MHNVFTSAEARRQGIAAAVLARALRCCALRLSRGIYVVAACCRTHPEFARFIDDPALLALRSEYAESTGRGVVAGRPAAEVASDLRRAEHRGVLAAYPHFSQGDVFAGVSAAMIHAVPLLASGRSYRGPRRSLAHGGGAGRDGVDRNAGRAHARKAATDLTSISAGRLGSGVRVETWSARESHRSRWVLRHRGVPPESEVVVWEGRDSTTAARTCVDLARIGTMADGVVAADWLISGAYGRDADDEVRAVNRRVLERSLATVERRPGAARARAAATLATGLAESPAESLALYCMDLLGVTHVRQQVAIFDEDGFVARVDFVLRCLDGTETVVEVDGEQKYIGAERIAGSDTGSGSGSWDDRGNPLFLEKRREDSVRRLGYGMVRLTWRDLMRLQRVRRLLHDANVI